MDIVTTVPGTMRLARGDDGAARYFVELPLLFTRVATGPSGIADVMIPEVKVNGASFEVVGSPRVHGLHVSNGDDDRSDSIAGEQIRQRPISFRPNDDGNNALVLVFEVVPTGDENGMVSQAPSAAQNDVELSVYVVFSNLATLRFRLNAQFASRTGRLLLDQPIREASPLLTNSNLVVLCGVVLLLITWNTWWNVDVYEQKATLSQKTVAALTGALLTFVGLSLGRIKAWLATLTDTVSVLKYPELHLNPALARSLSKRWFSVGLGGMTLLAGGLVVSNWSFETPQVADLVLYDTESEVVVPKDYQRIDGAALSDPRRFGWICLPEENARPASPVMLAYIGEGRRIEEIQFGVEYRTIHALDNPPETLTKSGLKWLKSQNGASELHDVMGQVLCGEELSEPTLIGDVFVESEETGDPLNRRYVISEQRIWEAVDVFEWLLEARREHLKALDFRHLFRDREDLLAKVSAVLEGRFADGDHPSHKSIVPVADVLTVTRAQLADIGSPRLEDKAIERSIALRALWRVTGDRRDRPPESSELRGIANAIERLLSVYRSWQMERALYELLLELQAQNPGSMESLAHKAAIKPWNDLSDSSHRYPRLLDYLTVAAITRAIGDPQRQFLEQEWDRLVLWAGPHRRLSELLVKRERERGDRAINLQTLEEEVARLATWIGLRLAEAQKELEKSTEAESLG